MTKRKILPALKDLGTDGQIRLLGAGRSEMSQDAFRQLVAETTSSPELAARSEWVKLDYRSPESYGALKAAIDGENRSVIYYLATPPGTFGSILTGLTADKAKHECGDREVQRIAVAGGISGRPATTCNDAVSPKSSPGRSVARYSRNAQTMAARAATIRAREITGFAEREEPRSTQRPLRLGP